MLTTSIPHGCRYDIRNIRAASLRLFGVEEFLGHLDNQYVADSYDDDHAKDEGWEWDKAEEIAGG